jgi:transcriptional regulator with XRE-family HTH domain
MPQKSVHTQAYKLLRARLISARRARKISQADLAKALGRPQSFIAKVEGGERRLDLVEFLAIASITGLNTAELIKDLSRAIK